jgi:hypothetical protein
LYVRARSIAGSYKIPGGSVDLFSSPGFDVERANFAGLLGPEEADISRPLRGVRRADQEPLQCSRENSLRNALWRHSGLLNVSTSTLYLSHEL